MVILNEKDNLNIAVGDFVERAREQKETPTQLIRNRVDRATEILDLVKRKGALEDERKYRRIRQAFDQNYAKLHPFNAHV
jgi:hypothetical protein